MRSGTLAAWVLVAFATWGCGDSAPPSVLRDGPADAGAADGSAVDGAPRSQRVRADTEKGDERAPEVVLGDRLRNDDMLLAERRAAAWRLATLGESGLRELVASLDDGGDATFLALFALRRVEDPPQFVLDALGRYLLDAEYADTAAHVLSKFDPASFRYALRALSDEDPLVRAAGLHVLRYGEEHTREVAAAAVRALQDDDADVRSAAAVAVAQMREHVDLVVPGLVEYMSRGGDDAVFALNALRGLGEQAQPAVGAMTRLLGESDADLARQALAALAGIGPGAGAAVPEILRVASEAPTTTPAAVDALGRIGPWALTQALRADDDDVRAAAAKWMAYDADDADASEDVLAALGENLDHDDPEVRAMSIDALGVRGVGSAAPAIARRARDDNIGVRRSAMMGLGRIASTDPAVVAALVAGLDDPDFHVRRHAIGGLGNLGAAGAAGVPRLIDMLRNGGKLHHHAAGALGGIGPSARAAEAPLMAMLDDGDGWVRLAAGVALVRIVPPGGAAHETLHALRIHDEEAIRITLVRVLAAFPTPGLLATVADRVDDRNVSAREQAAKTLTAWGTVAERAAPALVARLAKERKYVVQRRLIEALAAVGGDAAEARAAISDFEASKDKSVREAASAALAALPAE